MGAIYSPNQIDPRSIPVSQSPQITAGVKTKRFALDSTKKYYTDSFEQQMYNLGTGLNPNSPNQMPGSR